MAQSPAHRFGQIIGEVLEAAVLPHLERFAQQHRLYLDQHGDRACRAGKKCSWVDLNGNSHDLDFVLERGGTATEIGVPVAFIETAWRRYTKHSRNKAQEIQGAIEPLAETYRNCRPFKGAVLAGVFTDGALTQLRSLGFTVLYFPYDSVVTAFRQIGIDAHFDESTPDDRFHAKVEAYERASRRRKARIASALTDHHRANLDAFLVSLAAAVSRQIDRIVILVLHGREYQVTTVDEAIRFIEAYTDDGEASSIDRYEVEVRYNNGDSIKGAFNDKTAALGFLNCYQPTPTPSAPGQSRRPTR